MDRNILYVIRTTYLIKAMIWTKLKIRWHYYFTAVLGQYIWLKIDLIDRWRNPVSWWWLGYPGCSYHAVSMGIDFYGRLKKKEKHSDDRNLRKRRIRGWDPQVDCERTWVMFLCMYFCVQLSPLEDYENKEKDMYKSCILTSHNVHCLSTYAWLVLYV